MDFSLIVSTLGRSSDLTNLLHSLDAQSSKNFEVIIIDQNEADFLTELIDAHETTYPLKHIRTPGVRGASKGRNDGVEHSVGKYLVFPDDDCWYPEDFLASMKTVFEASGADIVCGRAADSETGRSINGRFRTEPGFVDRTNVWVSLIEWTVAIKREAFLIIDGFDEAIGVGADTPWQSCEGQDIVLRALDHDYSAYYSPEVFGHHAELDIDHPDTKMRAKGLAYANGFGRVLSIHKYPISQALYWGVRPLARAATSALRLRGDRTLYYLQISQGRLQGYFSGA